MPRSKPKVKKVAEEEKRKQAMKLKKDDVSLLSDDFSDCTINVIVYNHAH